MAVHEYGRGFYLVDSHSRYLTNMDGTTMRDPITGKPIPMRHLVDIEPECGYVDGLPLPGGEPYQCSCESFSLRLDRPCRHCIEVFEYLLPLFEHLAHWQPVKHCPLCGTKMKDGLCQNYGCESPPKKRNYLLRKSPTKTK